MRTCVCLNNKWLKVADDKTVTCETCPTGATCDGTTKVVCTTASHQQTTTTKACADECGSKGAMTKWDGANCLCPTAG